MLQKTIKDDGERLLSVYLQYRLSSDDNESGPGVSTSVYPIESASYRSFEKQESVVRPRSVVVEFEFVAAVSAPGFLPAEGVEPALAVDPGAMGN